MQQIFAAKYLKALPTEEELRELKEATGDSESFHGEFDDCLELKLMALDPEWMTAMQQFYKDSGMERWCA